MENPRNKTNLGLMVCWSNDYSQLGDYKFTQSTFPSKEFFEAWEYQYYAEGGKMVVLPLFLYEQDGLHVSISSPDNVNSTQIGYIYATFDHIKLAFGNGKYKNVAKTTGQRMSHKQLEHAISMLREEVKEYDKYVNFISNNMLLLQ